MALHRFEEGVYSVFKLADLASTYKARLEQLGAAVEGRIHSTRLDCYQFFLI